MIKKRYLRRGPGKDPRGNSADRRRRRQWLLNTFGDGKRCHCHWCKKRLTASTLTVDRIIPGSKGGRYTHDNIVPACEPCNKRRGGESARGVPKPNRLKGRWHKDYTTLEFNAVIKEVTR